jgi:coenzyme F420-reducing hydrogenase delta subunit/ferredoxin
MTQTEHSTSDPATAEPRIIALVCKWCTYAGADLAGTSRMVYPANVRTVMLPCTGRIDVGFVLRAFLQGADGVIVSGCHPGDCHYTAGNYRARRRWTLFRDLLDVLGLDLRRLEIAWISAAEGAKWVRTITEFTERIRALGPYQAMRTLASQRTAPIAPPAVMDHRRLKTDDNPPGGEVDAALAQAIAQAIESGQVKAVIGWSRSRTLRVPSPAWITSPQAASEIALPGGSANLVRLFKDPRLKGIWPIGIVARTSELLAINVLIQEAQIDPNQVLVFAVDAAGKFCGAMDANAARKTLIDPMVAGLLPDRPLGFGDDVLEWLDELMAMEPQQRWQFWVHQSARCIKCYACRQSCPMCNCQQCFTDKNQPQWFPTAADGPGNLAWHVMRAFHLAGRCVGCGACHAACPANIPLNLLSAALARSAMRHFGHRAGVDPSAAPLQSDYTIDDPQAFIR